MTENVYIHIPFCKQKCFYCSFVSFPAIDKKEIYIEALLEEIKEKYKKEQLKTLYIGGGTPSLLEADDFDKIFKEFNLSKNTEITVELNPENLTYNYLKDLYCAGVNRISIGCQTFDNDILNSIGRKHNSEQVKNAVNNAKKAGFNNISLDFIYGLPKQTIESFSSDLKTAVRLGVSHISLYGLKIEEGCSFYSNPPKNLPDEDLQADMYIEAIKILTAKKFKHYEISNFSLPGFESKHNLNYWNNNSYYGFGVAAHGYTNGRRYSNPATIEKYIKNPLLPKETKLITLPEKLEEEIFLGFRKIDGIDTGLINRKFDIDFDTKYKKILEKYTASKHLEKTKNGYKLSLTGIPVSNYILADFLEVCES